jgi:hypothetical protein
MQGQAYEWTCSVCASTWVLQSTGRLDPSADQYQTRYEVGVNMGYPNCVNEVYGSMSAQCLVDLFALYGFKSRQAWVNFDQAYAIANATTGLINPTGMYHYMAVRGISGSSIWVANSAPGYRGIYDYMSRSEFNALGPVQMVYLEP